MVYDLYKTLTPVATAYARARGQKIIAVFLVLFCSVLREKFFYPKQNKIVISFAYKMSDFFNQKRFNFCNSHIVEIYKILNFLRLLLMLQNDYMSALE